MRSGQIRKVTKPRVAVAVRALLKAATALIIVWTLFGAAPAYAQSINMPAAVCASLDQARRATGVPAGQQLTHEQAGRVIYQVALEHVDAGIGALGKKTGNNCPLPTGEKVSCDWLVQRYADGKYRGWDALIDDGRRINCRASDDGIEKMIASDSRSFVIVRPETQPPTEPPVDPPVDTDLDAVAHMVASMQVRLERIESLAAQASHESLQAALRALELKVQLAEHDLNLIAHREEVRKELDKAKSFFRRWIVEKLLPIIGGLAGGRWIAR
jgi:hypothetical protein